MDQAPGTDVFISYHANDAEAVRAFAVALQVHSISACFDPPQDDIEDIRRRTRFALGRAKAFIAWNSAHYSRQRGLQWEFMSAFAAASRRGEERQRIFLVNPEIPAPAAIPTAIVERCRVESPQTPVAPTEDSMAARVAAHVATLTGCLGGDANATPRWLPCAMSGFERFVGRTPELWRIHEFFTTPQDTENPLRTLQLIGSAGTGKSGLAQEYAVRFACLYPGGIFWLDAGSLKTHSSSQLQAAREHSWTEVAARLGLPVADRSFNEVAESLRRHLAERALPFLWIVDHAPAGMPAESIDEWLAPQPAGHHLGDNVLICRSGEYTQLGPQVRVDALRAEEAQLLLSSRRNEAETPATGVPQLIEQLTAHPLAMDLAGARLRRSTCERVSWHVTSPATNAMKLAQDLEKQCPTPYRNSIAVMLHRGIGHLESQARNCLRISAVLADAPIPIALTTTALAQQGRGGASGSPSEAADAIDELIDAALATRMNEEYFCVSPLVRCAVLSHEGEADLNAARNVAATTLASELTQAPEASYANPYLRWIPHALHISETAIISNQVVEIAAWLARFETLGALRTGNRRALTSLREGDVERAQQLLDMEYTATRRGLGEDHPGTITSVNNLGAVLGLRGELSAARSLFEHALEVRGKALGEQHPDTLTPLNNLAAILWSEADLEGAQALFECVVEHRTRWLGENHLETLIAMKNLAVTLRQQGDFVGARSLLERVVKGRQELLGPHHRDTRAAMASLARVLNEESGVLLTRAAEKTAPGSQRRGTERSLASVYLG
jgi:tetratricopeptide (TPR) repeat protein